MIAGTGCPGARGRGAQAPVSSRSSSYKFRTLFKHENYKHNDTEIS